MATRLAAAAWLAAALLAVGACASQPSAAPLVVTSRSPSPPPDVSGVLHVDDAAGKVVSLDLVMGSDSNLNGFNFNGLGKGRLQIAIPAGWTVRVTCRDAGAVRHSCGVVEGTQADRLAFPGASTAAPSSGTAPGQADSFTFVPDRVGSFRIACLVPGHMEAGMWASLEITASGSPTVRAV